MRKIFVLLILAFSFVLAAPMQGRPLAAVSQTFNALKIPEVKCPDKDLRLELTAVACGTLEPRQDRFFTTEWDLYFPNAMFENLSIKTGESKWQFDELLGTASKIITAGKASFYVSYNVLKGGVTVEYVTDFDLALAERKAQYTDFVTVLTLLSPVSFEASNGEQIRLVYLEQPKTKPEALQARSFVYGLTDRQNLIVEADGTPADSFKPARVYVSKPNGTKGIYLNLEIVRAGWATITTDATDDLKAAQDEAKNAKLGVWAI